jgi:hypothetical protein
VITLMRFRRIEAVMRAAGYGHIIEWSEAIPKPADADAFAEQAVYVTGEHGDLVDLIRLNQRHGRLAETIDEAERFLSLPPSASDDTSTAIAFAKPARAGSPTSARRLFAASKPLTGSLASAYLRSLGITQVFDLPALRFHPRCYYRANEDDVPGTPGAFPAMIAAVSDNDGEQTGRLRRCSAVLVVGVLRPKAW